MLLHIQDLRGRFPSEDACLAFLFEKRSGAMRCPRCQRKGAYHKHPTKPCYTCTCGRSHIYPKKGTLFEHSSVPLMKWFYAIFLISAVPEGISAKELGRKLKVTYVTAWKMAKKLRGARPSDRDLQRMRSMESLILRYAAVPVKDAQRKGEVEPWSRVVGVVRPLPGASASLRRAAS